MNILVTINGEKTQIQEPADVSLLSVLRKQKFLQLKRGCEEGNCGACTVLLDNKPVPSCRIPIALAMNKNIVTLEGFSKDDMYADIMKGFSKAGIKLCGYCNAGKIFATKEIISQKRMPSREQIADEIKHLSPCCVDYETLINGILFAFEIHNKNRG